MRKNSKHSSVVRPLPRGDAADACVSSAAAEACCLHAIHTRGPFGPCAINDSLEANPEYAAAIPHGQSGVSRTVAQGWHRGNCPTITGLTTDWAHAAHDVAVPNVPRMLPETNHPVNCTRVAVAPHVLQVVLLGSRRLMDTPDLALEARVLPVLRT